MNSRLVSFAGGTAGAWRIDRILPVAGDTLSPAPRLAVSDPGRPLDTAPAMWTLRGAISNERYVTRGEKTSLVAAQEGLGRPASTRAALIAILKSPEWWGMTQDERRTIFEEQSAHVQAGLRYLPAIARRLHHCRDLTETEPFDFLTWFEFRPDDEPAFDRLLEDLRASPEWRYVTREVDVRVSRE